MLLKDKTAIVYGASGAVGGAVAKAYAREVAEEIRASGGRAEIPPVDAKDKAAVEAHLATGSALVD